MVKLHPFLLAEIVNGHLDDVAHAYINDGQDIYEEDEILDLYNYLK